ncbi:MAG: hypothetical protein HQ522_23510 [Bacteroidetes bacterium]|nr:hypothetical protein [Bacteroidota bacterium]
MAELYKTCFVCKNSVTTKNSEFNTAVNLRVCKNCKGTNKEKETEIEYLDSLADGFVCGCI